MFRSRARAMPTTMRKIKHKYTQRLDSRFLCGFMGARMRGRGAPFPRRRLDLGCPSGMPMALFGNRECAGIDSARSSSANKRQLGELIRSKVQTTKSAKGSQVSDRVHWWLGG